MWVSLTGNLDWVSQVSEITAEVDLVHVISVLVPYLSVCQVVKPDALFLCRDGCAMTMPQGSSGTLHDLVGMYAKNAHTMPQLIVMHYAVEVRHHSRLEIYLDF